MAEEVLREKLELVVDGNAKEQIDGLLSTVGKLVERLSGGGGGGLGKLMEGLGAQFATAAAGAAAGAGAMVLFASKAIEAASASEKLELQVASFIRRSGAWSAAVERSVLVVRELDQVSLRTGEDVNSLSATFRSLTTITGGTDKQLEGMTEKLSVLGKLAGTTSKEILTIFQTAALSGQVRGPEAKELLARFSMTPEQIRQAYLSGQLLEYLTKKVGDLKAPADAVANSWDVLMGIFKNGREQILSDLGAAFEPVKAVFISLRDVLKDEAFRSSMRDIATGLKQIVAAVGDVVGAYGALAPFKAVFEAWGVLLKVVATQWVVVAGAAEAFLIVLMTGKNIITDFFTGGKGTLERLKNDFNQGMLSIALAAEKTKQRLDQVWNPAQESAKPGKAAPPPLYFDEQLIKKNLDNVTAMLKKLEDEVQSVGSGPEWDKAQARIAVHIDDVQKGFDTLRRQAQELGRDLPAATVEQFNTALAALRRNLETDALIKYTNDLEKLKLAIDGVSASSAQELANLELAQKSQALVDLQNQAIAKYGAGKVPQAIQDQLVRALELVGESAGAALRRGLASEADRLYAQAETIAQGTVAAFKKLTASLKTEGQIWADYLTGVWDAMGQAANDLFFDAITGRFSSMKDAIKGMLDSILRDFSKMVTDMVKRWILGQDEMKDGSGGGGFFGKLSGLFSSNQTDANGNLIQHGGTIDATTKGLGDQGVVQKKAPTPMTTGEKIGIGGMAALAAISAISGADTLLGGGVAQAGIQLGVAVASYVNVLVGVIIAAIGVIVQALIPRESEFTATYQGSTMLDAITSGVASGPAGSDREKATSAALKIGNSLSGFFADMFKDADPSVRASILADLNTKMKAYFASLGTFGAHAGSGSDFQMDIAKIFEEIIPKQLMHAMFGQITNMLADPGGVTGTGLAPGGKWGSASSFGAVDEKSPLVSFLTGLGFTIEKVNEIAGQIDVRSAEDFQKYFSGLVEIAMTTKRLTGLVKQTYAETVAADQAERAAPPAEKMASTFANVVQLIKDVSNYSGDTQITKGKEALAAAQTFYDAAKAAMLQLAALARQIAEESAAAIRTVQDALKTPAELYAQSFSDLQGDYQAMRDATNPEDLSAAWEKARTDFTAVAGVLVDRIKQIRSVLDDIHTLQTAMLTGPGADAQTNPQLWLQQNLAAMDKYRTAMMAATPGSPEQIAAATAYAASIRDRYQMELDMLARVKSAIESVNQTIDEALFGISLSEAGSNPEKAQLLMGQVNALYAQLQAAKSPEEINALVSRITGLTNQLYQLSPAGTAGHDQVVAFVRDILEKVRATALGSLGDQKTGAEIDIATLGLKLQDAEKVMSDALLKTQVDLDALVWHFGRAAEFATTTLEAWGVSIADQLAALDPVLQDMIKNFTDVNTALGGGGGGGGVGGGTDIPLGTGLSDFGAGLSDAADGLANFIGALGGPNGGGTNAGAPGAVNVTVTVNPSAVDPQGIADEVWNELVPALTQAMENNNRVVFRKITTGNG